MLCDKIMTIGSSKRTKSVARKPLPESVLGMAIIFC